MKDTVKERIKLFLKVNEIKAVDFCSSIGVSSGFISGMRESIQPDKLKSIAINYPSLNIAWLMTGLGDMFSTQEGIEQKSNNIVPQNIFHYTSLKNFTSIILSNSFRPSCFSRANDYKEIVRHSADNYKYISFVSDQIDIYSCSNPVMWNFYADNGNGVCIEFDREKFLKLLTPLWDGFITYRNGVTHIDHQNDLEYLTEKRIFWNYEYEYRFIYSNQVKCIHNIIECIKGIYFGCEVPDMIIERFASYVPLYNLLEEDKIKFNRMIISNEDGRLNRLNIYGSRLKSPVKNEDAMLDVLELLLRTEETRKSSNIDEASIIIEELKAKMNQMIGENRILREQLEQNKRKDLKSESA